MTDLPLFKEVRQHDAHGAAPHLRSPRGFAPLPHAVSFAASHRCISAAQGVRWVTYHWHARAAALTRLHRVYRDATTRHNLAMRRAWFRYWAVNIRRIRNELVRCRAPRPRTAVPHTRARVPSTLARVPPKAPAW